MATRTPSRAVQQRAARIAAQQAVAEARRRRRVVLISVAAVLAVAAAVGILVGVSSNSGGTSSRPTGVTAAGGIVVGSRSAPVKVVAYEDLQCPVCGRFERSESGALLARAVADGKVSVEYRIRSFLGPESVRAANALGAAQDGGKFEALREALYKEQPKEGTGGYSVDTLINTGRAVGLTSSSYAKAVRSGRYDSWVRATDDRASRDGNVATPELRVGGKVLSQDQLFDAAALSAALGL